MDRRKFIQAAATPAAASIASSTAAGAAAGAPNILILHCHDIGQFLHCYGVKTVRTPNLDRLAAEGVLFENSFCTAPQCSPSRSSIFTGRYPHSNGVMGLTHAYFAWELHDSERHLGQILRGAGYRTAGAGTIHETHLGAKRCGLDEYSAPARAAQAADAAIAQLGKLAQRKDKPFYMQVGFIEPHRMRGNDPNADIGFLAPDMQPDSSLGVSVPPYLVDDAGSRAEIAELQGSVRHVDIHMGRILEALRGHGLERDTLVMFTADHGIAMPRAKCSVYEPGLQVSCIVRLPSRKGWQGGRRQKELLSNVDYLPTFLDLAGVPVPSNVQGRSFAPLLDGGRYQPREEVFGELTYHQYYDPRRSVRTQSHKLIVNFSSAMAFMDPSQSWRPRSITKVPVNPASSYHPPFELYDLRNDPWEQRNLAESKSEAGVLNELRGRLLRHLEATADPLLKGAVPCPMHVRSMKWLRQS